MAYHQQAENKQMKERTRISSGTPWESSVGYSRAVQIGTRIYVSGTTATDENGSLVGENDGYAQAAQCIRNIEGALGQLGASLRHVVRTRMFVTDISRWQEFGLAHSKAFDQVRPCTSMVEVRALIDPRMLIEIEAEAEL